MDITGYRPHQMQSLRRVTIDPVRLSNRPVSNPRRVSAAVRIDPQLVQRAQHPQNRHPRVRLNKPADPSAYVHWQDYLDIANTHQTPAAIKHTSKPVEAYHQETMTEMFDRYRGAAQSFSDKLSFWFQNSYIKSDKAQVIYPQNITD